jgi:hypothetical protein
VGFRTDQLSGTGRDHCNTTGVDLGWPHKVLKSFVCDRLDEC